MTQNYVEYSRSVTRAENQTNYNYRRQSEIGFQLNSIRFVLSQKCNQIRINKGKNKTKTSFIILKIQ